MENREFARILSETADLMEIAAEDPFRIRSYRNAATAVEGHTERIEDILKNPERKVTEIPGVGKGIASVLAELSARGSFDRRDQLLEKYPPTALELLLNGPVDLGLSATPRSPVLHACRRVGRATRLPRRALASSS